MISALPVTPPDTANGAVAPTGDAPAGGTASVPGPFDFIMALETLAAQAISGQSAAAGASLTEGGEFPGAEDGLDTDELDDDADESALEFLAGLLNAASARPVDAGAEMTGSESSVDALLADGKNALAGVVAEAGALIDGETAQADTDSSGGTTSSSRANELLAQPARVTAAPTGQAVIATHVRDPRWADDFVTRVALLVRAGESQAALQLSPVDLGPVDVTVTVRDSQAPIHFGAAQAETRALIEASLPRLREMLAAQGFQLLDASVSQGFTRQSRPDHAGVPRPGIEAAGDSEPARVIHMSGLLDLYA